MADGDKISTLRIWGKNKGENHFLLFSQTPHFFPRAILYLLPHDHRIFPGKIPTMVVGKQLRDWLKTFSNGVKTHLLQVENFKIFLGVLRPPPYLPRSGCGGSW